MQKIKFTKMCGSGNDFIIIDNRNKRIRVKNKNFIKKICTLHYGIGADGVIFLENSKNSNFKMQFFNPDGNEAEMCGNGARCIALFAYQLGIVDKKMVFETKAGLIKAEIVKKNLVKIKMPNPTEIKLNISLKIKKEKITGCFVNTGVPHFVIETHNINNIDVINLGKKIRYHSYFVPSGTNVDFIEFIEKHLSIRTYERGVESETLACGTGVVAAAIISYLTKKVSSPVLIKTKNNEILKVFFKFRDNSFQFVYLEGKAQVTFEGEISYF